MSEPTARRPRPARSRRAEASRNERGSAEGRRRRRAWLLKTWRADVDGEWIEGDIGLGSGPLRALLSTPRGTGVPCCRCWRCGTLLTLETLTVDRIKPGCQGGTYRRDNIRPACSSCNTETGSGLRG